MNDLLRWFDALNPTQVGVVTAVVGLIVAVVVMMFTGVQLFLAIVGEIQRRADREADIRRDEHVAARVLLAESFRLHDLGKRLEDVPDVLRRSGAGLLDPGEFRIPDALMIAERIARIRDQSANVGMAAVSLCNEAASAIAGVNRGVIKRQGGSTTPTDDEIEKGILAISEGMFEASRVLTDAANAAPETRRQRPFRFPVEPMSKLGRATAAHFEAEAAKHPWWRRWWWRIRARVSAP